MAEKGFGVKEVNLIGASGTPTITSPNNLNLNANNVAISTNVSIGGTLSVTGNVSVGGTLTYEDVTNIDSVGLITARSGVVVGAGKSILVGAGVTISSSTKGDIQISGIATAQKFDAPYTGAGSGFSMEGGAYNNGYYINNGSGNTLIGMAYYSNNTIGLGGNGSSTLAFKIDDVTSINLSPKTGATTLAYAESTKLATTNTGVTVTGTLAATAVTGDGSGLTSLPAATPTDSDIQVVYTVTANGSSAYRFAGNGVVSTADNPDLYLIRGKKYRFINNSGGSHPFQIREASGGTAYSTGVTNNGAASGNIDFAPTFDSPAQLVYQCTSHGAMVGNIYLRGGNGNENNVGVITATNGGTSGLTMADQWRLTVGQTITTQDVVLTSWARPNTSGTGGGAYIGGGMSNSSGIFSFPTTGIYLITFHASFNGTNNTRYSEIDIVVTKNNSSYVEAARAFFYFNRPTGTSTGASASCSFIMDVDNISNDKVRFESSQDNVGQHQVLGDTGNATLTTVTFLRLGDT